MIDKREIIILTALKLFSEKGIQSVGINEIIKEASVAKKTLYHHFPSKETLIIKTLEFRDSVFLAWMKKEMESATTTNLSIYALFEGLDKWFNNKVIELGTFYGCFFINTAAQFKQENNLINQHCLKHKLKVRKLVEFFVKKFESDKTKADFITTTVCLLKEGAITTALVQHDKQAALNAKIMLKGILEGNNVLIS